ncbi:MAG TPA: DUF3570 domain-containing protein [Polyangiaceae bacterium]
MKRAPVDRARALVSAFEAGILVAAVVLCACALLPSPARADDGGSLSTAHILDAMTSTLRLESVTTRVSGYDQYGHGFQAQGGPTAMSPGSERLTVFEPQAEFVMSQGDRITHRLWLPADVVTNASPDAIDVMSSASRHVEAGSIDWTTTYRANRELELAMRNGVHLENPFRSWASGLGVRRSFADDGTVVAGSVLEVFDWFDRFQIDGHRVDHTDRSGTTGSVSLTQILTPTTVANVNYGITVLDGVLGNTWNSVPLASGGRGPELLPNRRIRHALVGRASQWLPWNGALRLYYRFYADDWGIVANTMEGQLLQRLTPELYFGTYYRFHRQTGAYFFTTLAPLDAPLRVADSDLAPLDSQTIGGKVVMDFPMTGRVRALHLELECERYVRTNDLHATSVSWATGFRF